MSLVGVKGLRKDFNKLLRNGLPDDSCLGPDSDFETVRSCYRDRSFMEDGTELEAQMQIAMFNLIHKHSTRIITMPRELLIMHEPFDFRPTNLFPTEFEAYAITADLLDDVLGLYGYLPDLAEQLSPAESIFIAYSDGLFSGVPLDKKATNEH